jgi:hypothetical protein
MNDLASTLAAKLRWQAQWRRERAKRDEDSAITLRREAEVVDRVIADLEQGRVIAADEVLALIQPEPSPWDGPLLRYTRDEKEQPPTRVEALRRAWGLPDNLAT